MLGAIGKTRRLSRLLRGPGGRGACFAFDHGAQLGPIPGCEDAGQVIADAVQAQLDGIILSPGLAMRHAELLNANDAPVVILRLDQTTMWRVGAENGYPEGHSRMIASVEEAVQMGADAVIAYLFTCHTDPGLETRSIEMASEAAQSARRWGIPLVLEPMAARNGIVEDVFDAEVIAMNCRIAAEIGADVVKTDWSGDVESFRKVTSTAGVPVLAAGGTRLDSDADVVATINAILQADAQGVLFGRNIFQAENRLALMREVRRVIHDV